MNDNTKLKIHSHLLDILAEINRVCEKNNLTYVLIGGTLLGSIRHDGFIPWDDDIDVAMPREDFERFIRLSIKELQPRFCLDYRNTNKKYWLSFAKVRMNGTSYDENGKGKKSCNNGFWVDIFPLDYTSDNNCPRLKRKKSVIRFFNVLIYNKCGKKIRDSKGFRKIPHCLIKLIPSSLLFVARNKIMQSDNSKKHVFFVNYGSQYSIEKQTHLIGEVLPTDKGYFEGKEYCIPKNPKHVLTNIYGPNYMQLPPKEKRVTHNPKYIKFEDGEEVFFNE